MRGLVACGTVAAILSCWTSISHATPDAAFWYRESLIGENACCFFRMVAIREQPGSYYSLSDTQRIERVRKSDLVVLESIPIMIANYRHHPDSTKWTVTRDTLRAFDMAGYIRTNGIAPAFPSVDGRLKLDANGIRATYQDGEVAVLSRDEIRRRAPRLDDDATLAGVEVTGYFGDSGRSGWLYIRIGSGSPDYDMSCIEYLLAIPESRLHD